MTRLRHAPAACMRIADRLIEHCRDIGLYANRTQSHVSASQYVHVGATDAANAPHVKIRISDHGYTCGLGVDYALDVDTAGKCDLRPVVLWLAKRYHVDARRHLQLMDARARHAVKAAATRIRRASGG